MQTLPNFDHHILPIGDQTISYEDSGGQGMALLLIHGLGDTRRSWRFLAPRLASAGLRVLLMDLRGCGDASVDFDGWAGSDFSSDALAVLDHAGVEKAVVVGCSVGGGTAAHMAAIAPQRVERIVLVNPFARDVPADRYFRPMVPFMFANPWGAWAWGKYFGTLLPTKPEGLADYVTELVAHLKEPGRLVVLRNMLRSSKADIEAVLDRVVADTLFIMGGSDPDFDDPQAEAQLLASKLGGSSRVEIMEGLGHYPHVEGPENTARLVLDFIAQAGSWGKVANGS